MMITTTQVIRVKVMMRITTQGRVGVSVTFAVVVWVTVGGGMARTRTNSH